MTYVWHRCEECDDGYLPADTGPSGFKIACPECGGESGWFEEDQIGSAEFDRIDEINSDERKAA